GDVGRKQHGAGTELGVQPHRLVRYEGGEAGQRKPSDQQTGGAAQHGRDQWLGEQLSYDAAPHRPEREPHGHLHAAPRPAREQQVRDVRARDQQHDDRRREEEEHRRPRLVADRALPEPPSLDRDLPGEERAMVYSLMPWLSGASTSRMIGWYTALMPARACSIVVPGFSRPNT